MRSVIEHVEYLRTKPHHVRRNVAFMAAFGISTVIALMWLIVMVSTNSFALQGSSFAESTRGEPSLVVTPQKPTLGLIGAAAGAVGVPKTPAHIEIVNSATSSTLSERERQGEQTVIPF